MKKSTLTAGLKAAAASTPPLQTAEPVNGVPTNRRRRNKSKDGTVLIGGHFAPEVRRTLLLIQAERENDGRSLKQLLGEAINDLCAKYRKPQPYTGEP
jgi:hypothetical protein